MDSLPVNLTFLQALGRAMGVPLGLFPIGRVFWVDSADATAEDSARQGKGTFESPFATLQYALTRCKNQRFDIVLVKPTHYEIITSGDLDVDVSHVAIVGLGSPTAYANAAGNRGMPQIELQASGDEFKINANGVMVCGLQICNSAAVSTNLVNIVSSGCLFARNLLSLDGDADKSVTALLVSGAASVNQIIGNRISFSRTTVATKPERGIAVLGFNAFVCDNEIYTNATASAIQIQADAGTIVVRNRVYNVSSVNADTFIEVDDPANFGIVALNHGFVGRTDAIHGSAISIGAFVSSAAIGFCQNYLVNEVGESGGLVPTAVSA